LPLREILFVLLQGLPAHHLDHEEPDARIERLRIIAESVSDASLRATCSEGYATTSCSPLVEMKPLDLGVLLVTQAYSESRLAKNVHEGNCREYECDPIRSAWSGQISHRARSLWQIHHVGPVESEWEHMQGSDLESTKAAAWAAAKLLIRGYRSCHSIHGAITRYAGIVGCQWSDADRRARLYTVLRERALKMSRAKSTDEQAILHRATRTSMR
jgi:hypothetical protein